MKMRWQKLNLQNPQIDFKGEQSEIMINSIKRFSRSKKFPMAVQGADNFLLKDNNYDEYRTMIFYYFKESNDDDDLEACMT